ncbi:hypothetical protein CLIB1423_19S01926 [[Candida] railenensis]|uniref:Uncharacterized protein n=1 Tax=[Candida] railenensis TaxID=45579 RepID=A0A9P0W0Q3_9ASCO|nr:hypothetical protein CLIB1423_19S01926 [[Candida] railenensis]
MAKSGTRHTKNDLLAKFQDHEDLEDGFFQDQDGGELEAPTLRGGQQDLDFYHIDDNFKTITIRDDELATIREGAGTKMKKDEGVRSMFNLNRSTTPTLRPKESKRYRQENEDDDFLDGFEGLSPGTLSTSSPKSKTKGSRRMSLSEYSEEVETSDTDVTSEFNDADIGDVDDIFGFEESGVYSSGGNGGSGGGGGGAGIPKESKAKAILQSKKKELQLRAEQEENELLMQRHGKGGAGVVNTLRLKDFHNYNDKLQIDMDALENEKTINYEYTRDEYEDFEDGFDLNSPLKIPTKSRSGKHSSDVANSGRSISSKLSMPQFDKEFKSKPKPAMKKYKSMMNVKGEEEDEREETGSHPFFNNKNNDIIRKLNRIPSFYSKKQQQHQYPVQEDNDLQLDLIEELESNNEKYNTNLDMEMEYKKKKLLEKYMEITNHQLRNKRERTKDKKFANSPNKKKSGSSLGLVRYLNDDGTHSVPVAALNSKTKMKFNPVKHKWEGNDIDLYKFEAIKSLQTTKPRLITNKDYKKDKSDVKKKIVGSTSSSSSSGEKIVGNMKYDPEAMKWVNLDEVEEDDDIFDDLPDLPIRNGSKNIRSGSGVPFPSSKSHPNLHKSLSSSTSTFRKSGSAKSIMTLLNASPPKFPSRTTTNPSSKIRGVSSTSAFTQRTASTASSSSSKSSQDSNQYDDTSIQQDSLMEEFFIDDKLIEKFHKEEAKWIKKTKHWFQEGESFDFSSTPFNKDYFWEIRKMVTDEEN